MMMTCSIASLKRALAGMTPLQKAGAARLFKEVCIYEQDFEAASELRKLQNRYLKQATEEAARKQRAKSEPLTRLRRLMRKNGVAIGLLASQLAVHVREVKNVINGTSEATPQQLAELIDIASKAAEPILIKKGKRNGGEKP